MGRGVLRLEACEVDLDRRVVRRADGERTLTWQEGELLAFLAARPGEPVAREDLLREVWERPGRAPPTRAVDIAMRRLREKIERVPSRPRHLLTERGSGYRFEPAAGAPRAARDPVGTLLAERDGFVGRAAEGAALEAALREASGVALVGPAGVGKTRLAVHHARRWQAEGRPVWLVDLHPVRDGGALVRRIADALGLAAEPGPPDAELERLARALRGRGAAVLVLDALEGVRDPGPVLDRLRAAGELRVVVTSRTALAIDGLRRLDVDPLPEADGVRLLLERARAVRAGWGEGADETVRRIVAGLDGLPLALELAAARASVLSPKMLLEALEDRFRVLSGATTLEGALEWSWSLLSPLEQDAAAQLAVFRGGFTVEAAAAVVSLPAPAPYVLDWLQPLVDKSIVRALALPSGEMRFAMLESQRWFAERALGERRAAVEARHRAWFAGMAGDAHARIRAPGGDALLAALARERENLEAAWQGASEPAEGVATALALDALGERQGPTDERLARLDRAVALAAAPVDLARARLARGALHVQRGTTDAAVADLDAALAAARAAGDRALEARVQDVRAELALQRQDLRTAEEAGRAALALATDAGDPTLRALAHLKLGHVATLARDPAAAERHFRATRALAAEGSWRLRLRARATLGLLARTEGRFADAEREYGEALAIAIEAGDRAAEAALLDTLGAVHAARGATGAALERFARALVLHREAGNRRGEIRTLGNQGILLVGAGRLEEGRDLLHAALDLAEAADDPRGIGRLHGNLGVALLQLGDLAAARRRLEEAARLLDGRAAFAHAYFSAHLAVACADLDDPAAAARALAAAEAGLDGADPVVRGLLRVVAAHLALARARARGEDPAEARALLAEAEALARAAGSTRPGSALETVLPSELDAALRTVRRALGR